MRAVLYRVEEGKLIIGECCIIWREGRLADNG